MKSNANQTVISIAKGVVGETILATIFALVVALKLRAIESADASELLIVGTSANATRLMDALYSNPNAEFERIDNGITLWEGDAGTGYLSANADALTVRKANNSAHVSAIESAIAEIASDALEAGQIRGDAMQAAMPKATKASQQYTGDSLTYTRKGDKINIGIDLSQHTSFTKYGKNGKAGDRILANTHAVNVGDEAKTRVKLSVRQYSPEKVADIRATKVRKAMLAAIRGEASQADYGYIKQFDPECKGKSNAAINKIAAARYENEARAQARREATKRGTSASKAQAGILRVTSYK